MIPRCLSPLPVYPVSPSLYVNQFRTRVDFCYVLQWGKKGEKGQVGRKGKKKVIVLRNSVKLLWLTPVRSGNDTIIIAWISYICWSPSLLMILAFAVVPPWAGKLRCRLLDFSSCRK